MYPKYIYHNDLEREITKNVELEDHHPEWYDFDELDLDDFFDENGIEYDSEDY